MLLSEIITDVVSTLRRPDLQSFVATRARQQIKLLHSMDTFPRDKIEQTLTLQNPGSLIRTTLPAQWRKFDIIVPLTATGTRIALPTDGVDQIGFKEVDPRKTQGYHNMEDTDYYYIAGDVFNVKMSVGAAKLFVAYYKYPDLTSDNAVTWITESFPELATYRILMICHRMLGNFEQATAMEILYTEALEIFKADSLYAGAL